jgi:polyphosphate glucokinase
VVFLCFDIGGTGLKAALVDPSGNLVSDRLRIPTPYPLDPDRLLSALRDMTAGLKGFDRVSMGFPGMVRSGRILTAPHFVSKEGPGGEPDEQLVRAWEGFEMQKALEKVFGAPARVANDADVAGSAVIAGAGLEMVVTLGTGFGTALFYEGRLLPHLELAHHPFYGDRTYNETLGNAARKEVGNDHWRKRVRKALKTLWVLTMYDHIWVGGGNATRLKDDDLPPNGTIVPNEAGLAGGAALWRRTD